MPHESPAPPELTADPPAWNYYGSPQEIAGLCVLVIEAGQCHLYLPRRLKIRDQAALSSIAPVDPDVMWRAIWSSCHWSLTFHGSRSATRCAALEATSGIQLLIDPQCWRIDRNSSTPSEVTFWQAKHGRPKLATVRPCRFLKNPAE